EQAAVSRAVVCIRGGEIRLLQGHRVCRQIDSGDYFAWGRRRCRKRDPKIAAALGGLQVFGSITGESHFAVPGEDSNVYAGKGGAAGFQVSRVLFIRGDGEANEGPLVGQRLMSRPTDPAGRLGGNSGEGFIEGAAGVAWGGRRGHRTAGACQ